MTDQPQSKQGEGFTGPMSERERALANARTAWSIESWPATYFAWKELALELAAFVIAAEDQMVA